MEDLELDKIPYLQILHALLRQDGSVEERDRTDRVMTWVQNNKLTLERVCDKTSGEFGLLSIITSYFRQAKPSVCPTRDLLDEVVRRNQKPKTYLDLLAIYDKEAPGLLDITDLDHYLKIRVKDYENRKLVSVLQDAKTIAMGSLDHPSSTPKNPLPKLEGARSAVGYILEHLQKGLLVNEQSNNGGALSDHPEYLWESYHRTKAAQEAGRLIIPTGIEVLDKHFGGLRRGELVGVLGYTGQRKTAVVRTIAYNAAAAGKRVLYIPVESSFRDEFESFLVLHAHRLNPNSTVSRRRLSDGKLTPNEEYELFEVADPNFQQEIASNLIIREPSVNRTWADVKMMIESECLVRPVDLVVVDYLTMLTDPGQRDDILARTTIVQEAKMVALRSNGGNGLCFVTPVQGNRAGYEDAAERDGAWDTTGIYKYSEVEKSLDNCLYVFTSDDLSRNGQLKIGSCKARRHSNLPSTFVRINVESGLVGADEKEEQINAKPTRPAMDRPYFDYLEFVPEYPEKVRANG